MKRRWGENLSNKKQNEINQKSNYEKQWRQSNFFKVQHLWKCLYPVWNSCFLLSCSQFTQRALLSNGSSSGRSSYGCSTPLTWLFYKEFKTTTWEEEKNSPQSSRWLEIGVWEQEEREGAQQQKDKKTEREKTHSEKVSDVRVTVWRVRACAPHPFAPVHIGKLRFGHNDSLFFQRRAIVNCNISNSRIFLLVPPYWDLIFKNKPLISKIKYHFFSTLRLYSDTIHILIFMNLRLFSCNFRPPHGWPSYKFLFQTLWITFITVMNKDHGTKKRLYDTLNKVWKKWQYSWMSKNTLLSRYSIKLVRKVQLFLSWMPALLQLLALAC